MPNLSKQKTTHREVVDAVEVVEEAEAKRREEEELEAAELEAELAAEEAAEKAAVEQKRARVR